MRKSKSKSTVYSFYRGKENVESRIEDYPDANDVARFSCTVCNCVWADIVINAFEGTECPACLGREMYPERLYSYQLGDRSIIVQDYEGPALDYILARGISPNEIIVRSERLLPIINLFSENSLYYPDIYIPHKNLVIDVRTTKSFAGTSENFYLSQENYFLALDRGFDYRFMIMDSAGKRIKLHSKWHSMQYEYFTELKINYYK